jgi:outer membrane protein TolC
MDIEELWANLRKATLEREAAEENFATARDALVSRLCSCYREGENWEDRAAWCPERRADTCPFYLEARRRNP